MTAEEGTDLLLRRICAVYHCMEIRCVIQFNRTIFAIELLLKGRKMSSIEQWAEGYLLRNYTDVFQGIVFALLTVWVVFRQAAGPGNPQTGNS